VQGKLADLSYCILDDFGLSGWNPVLIEVSGKSARDSNRTRISTLVCIRIIFQYLLIFGDNIFEILQRTLEGESQGSIHLTCEPAAVPAASSYVLFLPLLMGNDRQMSPRSGVGPACANPNVKRKLCLALMSMCSRRKVRKGGGGVEMAYLHSAGPGV